MSQTTTVPTRYYSDTHSVVDSLEAMREQLEPGEDAEIAVMRTDQIPLVAVDEDEMDDRNLWTSIAKIDDQVCIITMEKTSFDVGGPLLELSFHQDSVEKELRFKPARKDAIAPTQATSPASLSDDLKEALYPIVEHYNAAFTFAGVEAGSISNGGHYTDFEYEYSIDGVWF